MDLPVECTHCGVLMTSWAAPGSPVRYFQCPFCHRTFSSCYSEVFQRRAGARLVGLPSRAERSKRVSSPEDFRWYELRTRAARWFARLEAEERRHTAPAPARLRAGRAR